jgi:uncharacterized membrane protein
MNIPENHLRKHLINGIGSHNWKYGMFYYNKEDKRYLPPKRQEWMGVTVNLLIQNQFYFLLE